MSLTRTEYTITARARGGALEQPEEGEAVYTNLVDAEIARAACERIDEWDRPWIILERDVTEWTPVPAHAPDWPEDD